MMRTQLRPRMQLVPITFGGPRSRNGLLSWPVEILEELLRHRVAAHSLHPLDWHSARPHAWACIVGLLEKRVFFDNPDMGYDRVLRRCANDAKFASGGFLVDALFRFGLHMRDPEKVVRDAYLEAMEGENERLRAETKAIKLGKAEGTQRRKQERREAQTQEGD